MERGSPSLGIKVGNNIRKRYARFHTKRRGDSTIQANKSNLSIGDVTGTLPSFSCLFYRHSLAYSCFNDSVTQKVQETTIFGNFNDIKVLLIFIHMQHVTKISFVESLFPILIKMFMIKSEPGKVFW